MATLTATCCATPPHAHAAGMIAGVAHRRRAAGADPLAAAVVAPVLVLEPLLEIVDQFLGGQFRFSWSSSTPGHRPWPWDFEAIAPAGPGQVIQLYPHVGQFGPFKMVGKNLIVQVEIALAFHQDGPGGGVELVQLSNQTLAMARCRVRKAVGLTGTPSLSVYRKSR
jgi:hypothetical protein